MLWFGLALCAFILAIDDVAYPHGALPSDNGPSYIAGELEEYIEATKMSHVRDAPCHPPKSRGDAAPCWMTPPMAA